MKQKNDIKIEYYLPLGSDYLNRQSAAFFISAAANTEQKERGIKMIENKNDTSRNLEKALQALEQAKQRVA